MIDITVRASVDPVTLAETLKDSVRRKALRKALKPAVAPTLDALKSNTAKVRRFGYLKRSLSSKVKVTRNGNGYGVVGPRSKAKYVRGVFSRGTRRGQPRTFRPSYYHHLINRGSRRSKAYHTLDDAIKSGGPRFATILAAQLREEITAELQRIAK